MPLQKAIKDIPLGSVGLNLKVNPQVLPEGALTQAQGVQYLVDGALKRQYGGTATSSILPFVTTTFSTKEGNLGVASTLGVTRNYTGSTSSTQQPGLARATTLQPLSNQLVELPLQLLSGTTYQQATNISVASLTNCTFIANPTTKILICWQVTSNATSHLANSYYAIWDTATQAWFAKPALVPLGFLTFGNGFGSQTVLGTSNPMALSTGAIVLTCQFTSAGTNYSQGAVAYHA